MARLRKPTALHVIQGTKPRTTPRGREPKYALGAPAMPPDVAADPMATAAWGYYVPLLTRAAVLTHAHMGALANLCRIEADLLRVREAMRLAQYEQTYVEETIDKYGVARRRIKESLLNQRGERLTKLHLRALGEFGLTPVTQSKVMVHDASAGDPFEAFLGGGRPK